MTMPKLQRAGAQTQHHRQKLCLVSTLAFLFMVVGASPTSVSSLECINQAGDQCDGSGFQGNTCCPTFTTCRFISEDWSECQLLEDSTISPCQNKVYDRCGGDASWTGLSCCPAGAVCHPELSICTPLKELENRTERSALAFEQNNNTHNGLKLAHPCSVSTTGFNNRSLSTETNCGSRLKTVTHRRSAETTTITVKPNVVAIALTFGTAIFATFILVVLMLLRERSEYSLLPFQVPPHA